MIKRGMKFYDERNNMIITVDADQCAGKLWDCLVEGNGELCRKSYTSYELNHMKQIISIFNSNYEERLKHAVQVILWNTEPESEEMFNKVLCDICLIVSATVKDYAKEKGIEL